MASYVLDKAYAIEEEDGVGAHLVVVHGSAAGAAKLPEAANAGGLLGVTTHAQSREGGGVAVRKAGIARVVAAGAVSLGAPVNVAGASGKVKAVDEATDTKIECLGFAETPASADGDLIEVAIAIHERIAP